MISTAELAAMQAASQLSGDLTIQVMRLSMSQPSGSAVVRAYTPHASVAGNLAQPTAGQLQNYGYAIADVAAWMVRVPVGTDIQIGDRLIVGAQTLEVQIILQPQSYQTSMRVLCAEVQRT